MKILFSNSDLLNDCSIITLQYDFPILSDYIHIKKLVNTIVDWHNGFFAYFLIRHHAHERK